MILNAKLELDDTFELSTLLEHTIKQSEVCDVSSSYLCVPLQRGGSPNHVPVDEPYAAV